MLFYIQDQLHCLVQFPKDAVHLIARYLSLYVLLTDALLHLVEGRSFLHCSCKTMPLQARCLAYF